jgi:hypothetical protein
MSVRASLLQCTSVDVEDVVDLPYRQGRALTTTGLDCWVFNPPSIPTCVDRYDGKIACQLPANTQHHVCVGVGVGVAMWRV